MRNRASVESPPQGQFRELTLDELRQVAGGAKDDRPTYLTKAIAEDMFIAQLAKDWPRSP